jgi:hypothetical protein
MIKFLLGVLIVVMFLGTIAYLYLSNLTMM